MKLIIVESPAKAKTINKYLGNEYNVIASYGHVRDLSSKNGSVDTKQDFAMNWEIDSKSKKHVEEIIKEVKKADEVILATDPDREGEAISWHIFNILKDKGLLKNKPVKRVTFNAITKDSVTQAFKSPRDIDMNLVDAYLARRALDYLVGYTLSPVLWRKLPGSKSAGRVQSVALRLICDREDEIEDFKTQEYWSIEADFLKKDKLFRAKLNEIAGKKISKLDIKNEEQANELFQRIKLLDYTVHEVEKKVVKRNPSPPFITSTLQQDASRKLGFSARKTMQVAQKLYEGVKVGKETTGLITYMRTDGVYIDAQAVTEMRELIAKKFGEEFVPNKARVYNSKSKNAQEAHEAIRPTNFAYEPSSIKDYLSEDEMKLYNLIWKRAVSSQMEQASIEQVGADIKDKNNEFNFRATGSRIVFSGFLKLYQETKENNEEDEASLPELLVGDLLKAEKIEKLQHFTQPPPRYTEANLVKKMEELGIGRPSTYASIISVLQDRDYVTLENKAFIPENRGRIVTTFLKEYFDKYVQDNFTSSLEGELDYVSAGKIEWKKVLKDFWDNFEVNIDNSKSIDIVEVKKVINKKLLHHILKGQVNCPECKSGELTIQLGSKGNFVGCSNYPDCKYISDLNHKGDEDGVEVFHNITLGIDPDTGSEITIRKGPYGFYLQLGEKIVIEKTTKTGKKSTKTIQPKRSAIPKSRPPESITLKEAIEILSFPKKFDNHPVTDLELEIGEGRFGPYIRYGEKFISLKGADANLTSLDYSRILEIVDEYIKRNNPVPIGINPENNLPVVIKKGKYGYYLENGEKRVAIRKLSSPQEITLDEAIKLL